MKATQHDGQCQKRIQVGQHELENNVSQSIKVLQSTSITFVGNIDVSWLRNRHMDDKQLAHHRP